MKLKLKILFSIFFMLFIFAGVMPLTYAGANEWTQDYQNGVWKVCERTHWEKYQNDSSGEAQWDYSLSNATFHGYYGKIWLDDFQVYSSWRFFDTQELWYNLTIGDPALTIQILIKERVWIWGLVGGDPIMEVWVFYNGTELSYEVQGTYRKSPRNAEIFVWKDGDNVKVRVLDYYDKALPIEMAYDNQAVSSTWFENATLKLKVKHGGFGYFNAHLSDDLKTEAWTPELKASTEPEYPNIFDLVAKLGYDALPQFMKDWVDSITAWSTSFFTVLAMVWGSVTQIVPMLPMILLFWILDATITSVVEGDLHPIGNCMMTLYNTARGIIQAIVSIIHTIYDFIHFW